MPRSHTLLVLLVAVLLVSGCSAATPTVAPAPSATPADAAASPAPSATPGPATAPIGPADTPAAGGYPGPSPTATARPGYPAPDAATAQEVPAGDYTPQAPTAPAPTEGLGVVTGTLTRDVRGMPLQPIPGVTLYLAAVLRDSSGALAGLAGLDEATAPATTTDGVGQFAFTGVEPGLYLLIVKTPLSVVPVRDTDSEDVTADVVAGEVAELGIIYSTVTW